MSLDFKAPEKVILKPIITVFGVGGGGGNAVNNMIAAKLQGANFVIANTDAQTLELSPCENKIQLGATLTRGLGAGAAPDIGRDAAEESQDEIRGYLEGSNMVFVTAGMGGGTGTGASPVIAKIAKEMGILTVGVVTKPFSFEGGHRSKIAERGLKELQKYVDTLIVITNQNLFTVANEHTTFKEAFSLADRVLDAGVRSVTDLMIMPGLINLDFADISTVMKEMGKAMMGTGEASGEDRAIRAAEAAISNPLLEHGSIRGAKGVLINITGGADMTLFEVDTAATRISKEVGNPDANIIFGSAFDESLNGTIKVSVVATGIDADKMAEFLSVQKLATEQYEQNIAQELATEVALADEKDSAPATSNEVGLGQEAAQIEVAVLEEIPNFNQYTAAEQAHVVTVQPTNMQTVSRPLASSGSVAAPAKTSLFAKMLGSLRSAPAQAPVSQTLYQNQSHSHDGEVQDVPAFLRKQK
jgi:cell division protein FtsZ